MTNKGWFPRFGKLRVKTGLSKGASGFWEAGRVFEEAREAPMLDLLDEVPVIAVLDGLHAAVAGGFDVFELVVDKEDVDG